MRWIILSLACGTSFLLYLHRYTWGAVKQDVQKEFHLTTTDLGWLDGAFNFTYALGQIPGGMLGDWFGTHFVLTALILTWSLGLGTLALSRNLVHIYISRLGFGLAQAGCYPNLNKVTKAWFAPSVRTTVQGMIASFFGRLGGAASFIIFGSLMLGYFQLNWRVATAIFTVMGLAFTALFFLVFRGSPAEHPWSNPAESELVTSKDPTASAAGKTVLNWGLALRSGNLMAMVVQQFGCAFVDNVFQVWVIYFLQQQKHLKIGSAGWMGALPLLGGAVGGMFGGTMQNWIIGRGGHDQPGSALRRRWTRSVTGLTGSSMAALCMVISTQFDSATMIIGTFVVLKFFADWSQPTTWATITDIGGRNPASVFAIVNTSGSIAGVIAGPLMGAVIEWFSDGTRDADGRIVPTASGWNALFLSLAAIYLASALCWLFIDCTKQIDPDRGDASAPSKSA